MSLGRVVAPPAVTHTPRGFSRAIPPLTLLALAPPAGFRATRAPASPTSDRSLPL